MNTLRTGILMAALTGLFMAVGFLIGGQAGMTLAFLFAAGTNLFAYWNSDKVLLSMYGARQVDEASEPELVHIVQQLAAQAGLPMPKVFISENEQPNAFATGRSPEHAAWLSFCCFHYHIFLKAWIWGRERLKVIHLPPGRLARPRDALGLDRSAKIRKLSLSFRPPWIRSANRLRRICRP